MKQGRPGLTRLMLFNSLLIRLRGQVAMQGEIIALRHQLTVFQRTQKPKRIMLNGIDRCLWVWLSRLWSGWRSALIMVKPEPSSAGIVRDSGGIGLGKYVMGDRDVLEFRKTLAI
jgi:hypothetical protein